MVAKRARLYDGLALLTVLIVIGLDQWTKALVVQRLSPPKSQPPIPLIGEYLTIFYVQNNGAAFSMFANSTILIVLIAVAIAIVAYLYYRILNSGSLAYKIIFGMIIGGAIGNLIDRAMHGGYVVDFVFFRIPEIGYRFAIFNIADASISVGVFLLFVMTVASSLRRSNNAPRKDTKQPLNPSSSTIQPGE